MISLQRNWFPLAHLQAFNVTVAFPCNGDPAGECAAAFDAALAEIAAHGAPEPQIIRSRIWARDADLRRIASDARLKALAGQRRAASASFIAPERMPAGADVVIDVVSVGSAERKTIHEYDPAIAPPMFVKLDGLIFVSGNTDISPAFNQQLERICGNIGRSLTTAGAGWKNIIRVDAFISKSLDWERARADIAARFPAGLSMTTVEGYSAAEKLVELEVTASL